MPKASRAIWPHLHEWKNQGIIPINMVWDFYRREQKANLGVKSSKNGYRFCDYRNIYIYKHMECDSLDRED
jgi:hypothetical protein